MKRKKFNKTISKIILRNSPIVSTITLNYEMTLQLLLLSDIT